MNIIPCPPRPLPTKGRAVDASPPQGGWPSLSIITPSLNRADLIEAAIKSVRDQNYPSVEHIVVDGGSTDATSTVLAKYPHLRVIVEKGSGSHRAMNIGLKVATGQIVGFLNTDDLYASGIFHAIGRDYAINRSKMMAGQCLFFSREGGEAPVIDAELRHVTDPDLYLHELLYATPGFNSYFFERELLGSLGGVDERFDVAADRDLLIRLVLVGQRPAFISSDGYYYRRHVGSRTLDSGATLASAILSDHRAIASSLSARPALEAHVRNTLRQWGALETARLLKRLLPGFALGRAAATFVDAFLRDPLWMVKIRGGRHAVESLQRSYR